MGSVAHDRDGLTRQHELPQINGYPFHPSEQDMISAAGIKDQQLTLIVSMMLIELALLRMWRVLPAKWVLRRFDHSAVYRLIAGVYTPFLAQIKTFWPQQVSVRETWHICS